MPDYDEILDGTVDEVRDKIDDAVDLDYKELLQAEEEGKDRKTVKEYIEQKIGEEVDEEMHSEEDISEEDVLEEIEEESSGGILGNYSRSSVFAGGLLIGLLIGLVAVGLSGAGMTGDISKSAAQDRASQLVGDQVDVSQMSEENGLYVFNITMTGEQGNETVTQTQTYYMTKDGEKIIPTQSPLTGQSMVIDVDEALAAQEEQQQQPANETNTTE